MSETEKSASENTDYILDEQIGFLMRLASQRHASIFQQNAPFDLTTTQFAALVKLAERGACSQNELGRRTAMDVATIKGVVDRLRKKGFVKLENDPNDRRRSILSIADDKQDIVPTLYQRGQSISEETLVPLTADEQKTFLNLLKKMV